MEVKMIFLVIAILAALIVISNLSVLWRVNRVKRKPSKTVETIRNWSPIGIAVWSVAAAFYSALFWVNLKAEEPLPVPMIPYWIVLLLAASTVLIGARLHWVLEKKINQETTEEINHEPDGEELYDIGLMPEWAFKKLFVDLDPSETGFIQPIDNDLFMAMVDELEDSTDGDLSSMD